MRSSISATLWLILFSAVPTRSSQLPLQLLPTHTDPVPPQHGAAQHLSPSPSSDLAETIVSALSASTQHTTLLHLLQRAKCIPMLAHIGASTVFAPTDAAWDSWAEKHQPEGDDDDDGDAIHGWLGREGLGEWLMPEEDVLQLRIARSGEAEAERDRMDNQNWALRQHLLYHMLNYTLSPSDIIASNVSVNSTIETTLLFPLLEEPEHPPIPEPGPPWLPRGGEGLLGGHGQRIRVGKVGSEQGGERGRVGYGHAGQGGAAVWDGSGWDKGGNETESDPDHSDPETEKKGNKGPTGMRWVRNGVVIGIEDVLDPPPSIDEIIRNEPSLAYLSRLLPPNEVFPPPIPSFASSPHLTLFAPSNEAFAAFDEVEKRYLEGEFGGEGIGRVIGSGIVLGVGKGQVGWSDQWSKKGNNVSTATGQGLEVEAYKNGSIFVNGTAAESVDVFAANGVVHIVPSLLVPENFTLLNSNEKVLLSLNATRFVSLLRSANLSSTYVGEPGKNKDDAWTILAPTDEVLDMMDRWGHGAPLPDWSMGVASAYSSFFEDVSPLAALLQYHIIPGRLMPADLKDGLLVGTELRTSSLDGARQRLPVELSDRIDRSNWEVGNGEIRFGGATVLGKPVRSGKSVIYLISSLLSPPDDVLQTAVSDLQLSTFIAAVYAADLDKAVKKNPATTYLMPRNRAFGSLGLAMKYLLLPEGKDELRKVVKYHAVDEIVYSQDLETGKQVFTTLEGGEIVLRKTGGKNSSTFVQSPNKWEGYDSGEQLPSNGELRPAKMSHFDALTSTGVIHTIDAVILPSDVFISIGKLIRGSKQSTMMDLMARAGLSWILEGRQPSANEVERAYLQGVVRTWDNETDQPDIGSLAMPSYTVLCPSDKAFSRLNLTHYLNDQDALLNLLKLHIIPTQPNTPRTANSKLPASPPSDGAPLSLEDDLVYSTLLSSSSRYGDVAFRATGDNSFLVGIRNARSGAGNDAARLGATGRASVRWKKNKGDQGVRMSKGGKGKDKDKDKAKDDDAPDGYEELWRGGMTLGGGVVMLDSVLVPYEPSWFSRWGWLVLTLSGVGIVLLVAALSVGWWYMTRNKAGYEPLEGEEDE